MFRTSTILLLSIFLAEPNDSSAQVSARQAIARGLSFLQADAIKWRAEHDCATCHHGALSVWAFSEAKSQSYPLDTEATADIAEWTKTRFFEKLDQPRAEEAGARLVSLANIYLALSGQFVPTQDLIGQADLDRIGGHLVRHQEADGSWSWSSAPRKNTPPPAFESDEAVTLMAYLALESRGMSNAETTAQVAESRQRATDWLQKSASTGTTQALAFRLLVEIRAGKTGDQLESALAAVRRRQNDDGGWGQVADATSDAYATGQVLYALSLAGVSRDSAEVQRAVEFLVAQQRDDGSWPMTSRAHPGEQPFTNPVPITYFGSAWAMLGLLRTFPAATDSAQTATDRSDQGTKPGSRDAQWRRLAPFAQPPAEFAGDLGPYKSPLRFADGSEVKSAAEWTRRRQEILDTWHRRLGPWPELVEQPRMDRMETVERQGYTQHHVHVQLSPEGQVADGYLLVPAGEGPFPAVLVPFYEPLTSIGEGEHGHGTHDYGLQLVRRGFVTLSIGTPGSVERIGLETRQLLVDAGVEQRRQPLTLLAYVAANCHTALAQMREVDPARIGIIGLSYGGKWSMFASCLYEKFACAVWSDPGIVFDEENANVNYWEPWYLGYDPDSQRQPGVPSAGNPRTGLYRELVEAGDDLVDLHALMAPRPVLVSGGTEDPPRNWRALNHLVAVNKPLGHESRVAMIARSTHVPTAEALELELQFLEYWLRPDGE